LLCMKIIILGIVDDFFPGRVECSLVDAWGSIHLFNEKIPIVTCSAVSSPDNLPQDGIIRCVFMNEWIDDMDRKIITVCTEKPDGVESINGTSNFDLLPCQLLEWHTE